MIFRTLPVAAALAAIAVSSAAIAQEEAGEKVNMVIVYGDDACPVPEGGEITVCARKAENERYRIPEDLRLSDSPQNTAWTQRVESYEMVGAFGTMSCDPAGAGGFTGCTQQMINAAYKDRSEGSAVRFSQLIEAARVERLSTIDVDAAAQQARVEQIEREYLERLKRESEQPLPGEVAPGADAASTETGEAASGPQ
ncbi:MAG: hypothetical protein A3J40_01035 [Erythrobacter sp. RIFCSPHIGHO2_12_FULL_63_10]|nr:MAG: hypothetical protein A3J40_01035 [Erythrobacter sp. RIFCSPHIGHO2_12_FULL_63_10]